MSENNVVIEIEDINEISAYIKILKTHNLLNDRDFTFLYEPNKYDDSYMITCPKRVIFFFKEAMYATWFSLSH